MPFPHALADAAGALFTLAALGALGGGGYLLALRLLGAERARCDTLELATATLLCATAEGVAVALALGACGQLRPGLALALQGGGCACLLAWPRRLRWQEMAEPAALFARRLASRLRQHLALSVIAVHAIGSEELRGLLRPPLSWDSLMYHLWLTATWLQRHDLAPVFGAYPLNFYGYSPANGSLWLWWWMAPSHSEIYANLAFLPQWVLLGLATGAVARRLGARDSWPLAAFVVVLTPTVLRFAATQYVDIFTAGCLVAACCFGLAWVRQPDWGGGTLAALGLGVAAGAKVLGLLYAGALAPLLLLLAPGSWRRRTAHAAAGLVLVGALGGFFYLRNAARGVDPLALECEGLPHHQPVHGLPRLPRPSSVAALPHQMLAEGQLLHALLGTIEARRLPFADLGLGPQALLVLLGLPALAWLPRERWREAAIVGGFLVAQIACFAMVPYAANNHVFANVRYLLPALGLAVGSGFAAVESRCASRGRDSRRWLGALAVALAVQDLLQLHAQLSGGVRLTMAAADLAAVVLGLSPRLRSWLAGVAGVGGPPSATGRRLAAAALLAAAVTALGAPWLARFRVADRTRAFHEEYTAHGLNVSLYASGWDWLDRHAGSGTVAVMIAPDTFFIYPAMGPYLERRAIYVNVNPNDLDEAAFYPLCQPRVHPAAAAWIVNLRRAGVRWLDLARTPPFPFPMEREWARARPDLFAQRFADANNEIYEVLPATDQRPGA